MDYIDHGGARVVFREGDSVLKIPYNRAGLTENRHEAEQYALTKASILASCVLLDSGWLRMEYLPTILTFEYACFLCGSHCTFYDDSSDPVTPKRVTCDLNCEGCDHNIVRDFSDVESTLSAAVGEGLRVQVGQDASGALKLYDYGCSQISEYSERGGFYFNEAYLPLFLPFVEDGHPEDFAAWASANCNALPRRAGRAGDRLREFNRRVRMRVREEKRI